MLAGIKSKTPWRAKIAAKVVMSRLPVSYGFWKRLGLFEHGKMEQPTYAYEVFKRHFDGVDFPNRDGGFAMMELGPGETLFSGVIAYSFGASRSYLIDVADDIIGDLAIYRKMVDFLAAKGLPVPDMTSIHSLDELRAVCKVEYKTSGLSSMRILPDESVDFVWSQAVLEHVRRADFLDTMREMRRVMRPDGACSHSVDLKDHLAGALNHLRFSERLWESDFMASSGFYTNRIRFSEMLDMFRQAGFEVESVEVNRWEGLPTPRAKLAEPFKSLPDDELRVSGFDVILRAA